MPGVSWVIKGEEFGNCNCDYSCPCQFEALPTHGDCRGTGFISIDKGNFGDVSLNIFLAMSLMSMQLWTLGGAATAIMVVLIIQVLVMTGFAMFVVFRAMGRDYDAAVMTAGFAGLGLGATPVAIANMNALTSRFGPSAKAFLIIPLVGAFFIDLLNAVTIKFFIGIISRWMM